jgi:peptidoglycan/LPS O-acetylase OafA/YrhL
VTLVKTGRWFVALGVGELVIVVTYVLDRFTDADLSSASTLLKLLLVVGAALIAGSAYHSWSATPTSTSLLAMLLGLLGGAALASTVVSAHTSEIYASATMATIGTIGLVASVAFAQIGLTRSRESQP